MVCLLTPAAAARWMAESPRFRRSVPRLVSISDIFSTAILSAIPAGHRILSCKRYIAILTRHVPAPDHSRSRHADGPLPVLLRAGGKSRIEVNAQASLLETASGSVSYHVSQPQLETLPLDGRNFIPLVALSPGVALPGGGSLLPRINGSRPRTNEYLYDGISVLQPEPGQVAFYPI